MAATSKWMKKATCLATCTRLVTATQVEEQFAAGLSVSPNPSKGLVRIALPSGFELAKLQWFDSMGRALGESEGPTSAAIWTFLHGEWRALRHGDHQGWMEHHASRCRSVSVSATR